MNPLQIDYHPNDQQVITLNCKNTRDRDTNFDLLMHQIAELGFTNASVDKRGTTILIVYCTSGESDQLFSKMPS